MKEEREETTRGGRRRKREKKKEKNSVLTCIRGGMYMSVSLFCPFSHEETQSGTRAFHDMCCSKPLTFHNGFMFFASRSCFKHFFKFQATPLVENM